MEVVIMGGDALRARMTEAGVRAPLLLGRALYQEAELIMTRAKRMTPVGGAPYSPNDPHPGNLRASGTVLPPEVVGTSVLVTLGFGGAASAYAHRQHEEGSFRHHVGEAKFLEKPVLEAAPGIGLRLAPRMQGLFGA